MFACGQSEEAQARRKEEVTVLARGGLNGLASTFQLRKMATQEAVLCVYLLRNASGRTYVGFTNEPQKRLRQHNGEIKGGARKTRMGRPWEMLLRIASEQGGGAAIRVGVAASDNVAFPQGRRPRRPSRWKALLCRFDLAAGRGAAARGRFWRRTARRAPAARYVGAAGAGRGHRPASRGGTATRAA